MLSILISSRLRKCFVLMPVVLLVFITNTACAKGITNMLTGYIEIEYDYGIDRIIFPSVVLKTVLSKQSKYFVNSFDLLPINNNRIIAFEPRGDVPSSLVMYLPDEKFKTIASKGIMRHPSSSPDGKQIAYLYCDLQPKQERFIPSWFLYSIEPDGARDRRVSECELDRFRPSWFADGKVLAVTTKDLKICIINTDTGNTTKIIDFGVAPTVSHDGKKIAYLSNDELDDKTKKTMIDLHNLTTQEYNEYIIENKISVKDLDKINSLMSRYSIFIYDIEKKESKKITSTLAIEDPVVWSPDDRFVAYSVRRVVNDYIDVLDVQTGKTEQLSSKFGGKIMLWRDN